MAGTTTEDAAAMGSKRPLPLPPALLLLRARSRATRVADLGDDADAATPPRRSPVTVPFLWEEAPGKPRAPQGGNATAAPAATGSPVPEGGGAAASAAAVTDGGDGKARPVPLKLPPRLQQVASTTADSSLSPKAVLQGPYGCTGGAKWPPRALRRSGSSATVFRRTPSAGVGLFSRSKATGAGLGSKKKGGHDHHDAASLDASCSSPAPSSASSSSSSSLSTCFGDDHGHGAHRRPPADGREDSEEDECAKGSVRITRFRRIRSLPSMTSSHLLASIRKSVKQITPWS